MSVIGILIVEDDKRLGPTLRQGLSEQGYAAVLAPNARAAMAHLKTAAPDAIVLDLGLPDRDGVDLLRDVRAAGCTSPVLILTARDKVANKVQALDAGADDYLGKPFALAELLARLRALLRRPRQVPRTLACGELVLDLLARRATRGGHAVDLTPREFDLLAYLAAHPLQTVSRETLAREVWREAARFTPLDNVIDVHLSHLRRKLADAGVDCPVQVVRGAGIRLRSAS
jgi:DNA-binding response OmpR family regulator